MKFARSGIPLLVLAIAGGSCSVSLQELCTSRIPTMDRELGDAIARLAPPRGEGPARAIASAAQAAPMSEDEREGWTDWAEGRLREAQHAMDAAEAYPSARELRSELSTMAKELVAFHGYAQAGDASHMAQTLERIQIRSRQAAAKACPREISLEAASARP
jgi:hypothetical protein